MENCNFNVYCVPETMRGSLKQVLESSLQPYKVTKEECEKSVTDEEAALGEVPPFVQEHVSCQGKS